MDFRQSNNGLTGPVPGKVHPCWIHGGKSPEKSLFMWKYQHNTVAKVSEALHEGYLELTQQSPPPQILPLWHHSGITFYLQQYLGYSYICISGIVIIQFRCWHNALTQISDEKGSSPQLIVTGQGNSLYSWGGVCLDLLLLSILLLPTAPLEQAPASNLHQDRQQTTAGMLISLNAQEHHSQTGIHD